MIEMNKKIKSFNEFNEFNDQLMERVSIRTASAAALVAKSNSLSKDIKNIKIKDEELDKKLNSLSRQLLFNSYLIAQLGIMNRKK